MRGSKALYLVVYALEITGCVLENYDNNGSHEENEDLDGTSGRQHSKHLVQPKTSPKSPEHADGMEGGPSFGMSHFQWTSHKESTGFQSQSNHNGLVLSTAMSVPPTGTVANVLQKQWEQNSVWTWHVFYAVVVLLSILVLLVSCLIVLYRLKEKVELSGHQLKELSSLGLDLSPMPQQTKGASDLGQTAFVIDLPGECSVDSHGSLCSPSSKIGNCPFRLKPASSLLERRGSNVSLVLPMGALGTVDPLCIAALSPHERTAQEYLRAASQPLTHAQLLNALLNASVLHAEFAEIPMNFVDPEDLDIPSQGTKNRYKTILPNQHSRVILKIKNCKSPIDSYINANYITGYPSEEWAFIATQGPMINTVNDFWQMAWQEDCPAIVMITKLKEKSEKCVLYWPEKRGIYGEVEVFVISMQHCEHYTVRTLVLKHGGQARNLKHYWYTSWPDHKTPDSAQPLLQLTEEVEKERRSSGPRGPVVVHCSAGIGRTGCFIATTIGCRQLRREGVADVLGIVCQLRMDRGGMIQTGEQYEFIHHALYLYGTNLSGDGIQ